MGFLRAKPSDWSDSDPPNRAIAHHERTGRLPSMPPVEAGEYLLQAWTDLGRVETTPGLGSGPLRFAEIEAGCPWTTEAERRVIRQMSEHYLQGIEIGKDVLGIPPWEG